MKYCACDKGFSILVMKPFLHVRVVDQIRKEHFYLRDANMLVDTKTKRSWNLHYGGKITAYQFHSLVDAKRATKVSVVKQWLKRVPGSRVEITCRHCRGVVWPKDVLVQLAEQA